MMDRPRFFPREITPRMLGPRSPGAGGSCWARTRRRPYARCDDEGLLAHGARLVSFPADGSREALCLLDDEVVVSVAAAPDGQHMALGCLGGAVYLLSAASEAADDGAVRTCSWSPGATRLAVLVVGGWIELWRLPPGPAARPAAPG